SKHFGIGASVGVNEVTRHTEAVVGNQLADGSSDTPGSVISGGDMRLSATNGGFMGTFAISGSITNTNHDSSPQGSTGVPTSVGQGGAGSTGDNGGGVSISGAVTINTIDDNAEAYVRHAGALTIG